MAEQPETEVLAGLELEEYTENEQKTSLKYYNCKPMEKHSVIYLQLFKN